MAFRTRCFSGLIKFHFTHKQSLTLRYLSFHEDAWRENTCTTTSTSANMHAYAGARRKSRCLHSWERILKLNTLEKRLSTRLTKFSRPMSQSSEVDADTERMQRVFEQSSQPERTSGDDIRLIYEVRSLGMMRFCTLFFYVTSLMGLYMSPDLITSALEHDSVNSEMILNFVTIIVAVAVMPSLLTMFNKRLMLRMYYNSVNQSYVAVTQTPLLTLKRMHFRRDEVIPTKKKGTVLGLFNLNTLKAKGHPYYVNAYNFKIPSDFNHLMGYE